MYFACVSTICVDFDTFTRLNWFGDDVFGFGGLLETLIFIVVAPDGCLRWMFWMPVFGLVVDSGILCCSILCCFCCSDCVLI